MVSGLPDLLNGEHAYNTARATFLEQDRLLAVAELLGAPADYGRSQHGFLGWRILRAARN